VIVSGKGVVFSLPVVGRDLLLEQIESKWTRNITGVESLVRTDKDTLVLVSHSGGIFCGEVCPESDFIFSDGERTLLVISVFITLFLIIFIIFNLRHDDSVVIDSRIKRFQYSLLREYIDRKDSADWASMVKDISRRKIELNGEIKKSLGRRGKLYSQQVDELLDKSWAEVLGALAAASGAGEVVYGRQQGQQDEEPSAEFTHSHVEEPAELEELPEQEQIEDVMPLEELEGLPEAESADEVGELEELEDAGELEELPECEPEVKKHDLPVENIEPVIIKEQTLDEFRAENVLEQEDTDENEEIKKRRMESEQKFSVIPLDFTDLDSISGEKSLETADMDNIQK
jgi:hypothetical protein